MVAEQRERQPEGRLSRLPAPPLLAPPPSPPRPPAPPQPAPSPRPPEPEEAAAVGRSKSPAGNVPRRRRVMAPVSPSLSPPPVPPRGPSMSASQPLPRWLPSASVIFFAGGRGREKSSRHCLAVVSFLLSAFFGQIRSLGVQVMLPVRS